MREDAAGQFEERLSRLEREIRELKVALGRNSTSLEAAIAEMRAQTSKLAAMLQATSRSTEEIAQSRIWRVLVSVGGLMLRVSRIGRRRSPAAAPQPAADAYARWIAEFEWRDEAAIRKQIEEFTNRPLISVVVAAVDPSSGSLGRTLASLNAQTYPEWELCVAGRGAARRLFGETPRQTVRAVWLAEDPWRAALELTAGDFVAFLPPGATLAPDALFHMVALLNREPRTDVLYSDEDSLDAAGNRRDPFFKPAWSPDLLLSMNYIGGLLVVRRSPGVEAGARDVYDLLLRVTTGTSRVRRVPRVLLHAPAGAERNVEADRRSVNEHLLRTHPGAWTEADSESGRWRVRYPIPQESRVSIIIPSAGNVDLLQANLSDLASKTDYPGYDVVVADNSRGEAVEKLIRGWSDGATPRYFDCRHRPFNFASICNDAARSCEAPFLLFLNDDTRLIGSGWLTAMIELGARPEVGAVGARLLFPNGRIQHAGLAIGVYGRSGHVFKGLDAARAHYFGLDRAIRNVSAVTGACLLVRAGVFAEVGGFDEDHFPVDANDVDLCLRIGAKGYRVLYTPYAQLYHYESLSRGAVDRGAHPGETQEFARRWADCIRDDPFYSPNLTRSGVDYSPRKRGE